MNENGNREGWASPAGARATDELPRLKVAISSKPNAEQRARIDHGKLRAAIEQGRAEATAFWPVVRREGYEQGFDEAVNRVALVLRKRVRREPAARALLLDVLEDV